MSDADARNDDADGPLGFGPEDDRARAPSTPPEPVEPPVPPARLARRGRLGWIAVIAAILAVAVVTIHAARPEAPGARGLQAGTRLPPFAVPLATSQIVCDDARDPCDANIAASGARARGSAGSRPACAVRGPTVLNACQINERGPLVLGLIASRAASCTRAFDGLQRLARRHPGLQVAAVAIGGSLETLREVVRERGWGFPVGWDRDGALATLYGVAACPYFTVARSDGRVQGTLPANASTGELERLAGAALAASRRLGWRP